MSMLKIKLAAARVNAGLTQGEVADKLHVSSKTIVNWETGRVTPSFTTLSVLSQLYGIPIDNIFLPSESTYSEKGSD